MISTPEQDQLYLQRCLELALRGQSRVEPNPRVGAVVVHDGQIIGEGWHQEYGGPHAEVNAIQAVKDPSLLLNSTLYVSLEPCNHVGKTPACAVLILKSGIPRLVVGCTDPNPQMAGRSLQILKDRGVEVILSENPVPFQELLRHFQVNQQSQRPYITVKWAQSKDGFIAARDEAGKGIRTKISEAAAATFTHQLRAEHSAILIGANTALIDLPSLSTRHFPGPNPVKILLDPDLSIPLSNPVFSGGKIIVINSKKSEKADHITWLMAETEGKSIDFLQMLYQEFEIGSILVEGGSAVLTDFLQSKPVDEIVRITAPILLGNGIKGPENTLFPSPTIQLSAKPDVIEVWKRSL